MDGDIFIPAGAAVVACIAGVGGVCFHVWNSSSQCECGGGEREGNVWLDGWVWMDGGSLTLKTICELSETLLSESE